MVVVPEMLAVGNALTVIVAEPDCDWLQLGLLEATLTKSYMLLAVSAGVIKLAFPAAPNTIVWFAPASTV